MKFYIDTSVWGGYEDDEFSEWTKLFFKEAEQGKFSILLSDLTLRELSFAPEKIKKLPYELPIQLLEPVELNDEHIGLAKKYVEEGALTEKFYSDAQHIAMASILKADSLVSWNFRHMVNFFRIRQYNAVNLKHGYSIIDIRTPKEVLYGEC